MSTKEFSERENASIDDLARLLAEPLDPVRRRLVVEMAWLGGRASGRVLTADSFPDECGHVSTDTHGWMWSCTHRAAHPGIHCLGRRVTENGGDPR